MAPRRDQIVTPAVRPFDPRFVPSAKPAPVSEDAQPVVVQGPVVVAKENPFLKKLYEASLRRQDRQTSDVFDWPSARPLAVHVVNGLDVTVRVRVQVRSFGDAAQAMMHPVLEFDVGAGDHEHPLLSPGRGDSWAPHAWCEIDALGAPTSGSLTIVMETPGD